ncbi:hypothetical protein GUJ93_ZPchr0003g18646 [Zizania palustris]|uniref:IST1-like protein n=1 Tax=Zizania palustris TaxID=103762 RepID=A0A8J5VX42_ZIZPA|nr:hypothetical protein GUJ93_ZPchr0003g18646 [Zizania palustris]
MGRTLDVLLGRTTKQTARLKSMLGLAVRRLGVLRGHREVRCAQARGDVEQLLRLGHPDRALLRAEQVIREQSTLDVFLMLEAYCNLVVERVALVDSHRECPEELREAAAGLVYAAARCGDVPELQEVKRLLAAKFGREFVSAAADLRTGCGINAKIVQKLSTKQPSLESRQMVLQEIAAEKGIATVLHVSHHEPSYEDSGSNRRGQKRDDEMHRFHQPRVDLLQEEEEEGSADSARRYRNVEAAAQAAFESAATAAAAAKAAMELSRGQSGGPNDRRMPGSTQVDDTNEEDLLAAGEALGGGKKFGRIGHVRHARNHSSEIEELPEDDAGRHEITAESKLQVQQQQDSVRSRPISVRTKRGF